jgi:ferredoxin
MTYKDFDSPGEKNFIYYLFPGVDDITSSLNYDFTKITWPPVLIVFLGLFPVMFLLRTLEWKNPLGWLKTRNLKKYFLRIQLKRGFVQTVIFMTARMGIFRVSGACPVGRSSLGIFPFINCQSCELATGACPIGTFQMSLLNKTFPILTLNIVFISGFLFGRFICGWFCPFGFLSDILNKLSKNRKLPQKVHSIKYFTFGIFLVSCLWALIYPFNNFLFYCAFICPAGLFYGVYPFYLTSARFSITSNFPNVHFMFIYHILLGIAFIYCIRQYTGRIFCLTVCPLGTFYSLFNKIAVIRILFHKNKCNSCGACSKVCTMNTDPTKQDFISRSSCIACGKCINSCSRRAIEYSIKLSTKKQIQTTENPLRIKSPVHDNHNNIYKKINSRTNHSLNIPKVKINGGKYENITGQSSNSNTITLAGIKNDEVKTDIQ